MRGFWSMLFGDGFKRNREQHRRFDDAIPYDYPSGYTEEQRMAEHPAYSGPLSQTSDAANYRRANQMRGPKSKMEHRAFQRRQDLIAEYQRQMAGKKNPVSFREWEAARR